MIASPGSSPRPARPTTCVSSWNVRSAARKSARPRPTSAETTPTSVTRGKSWPLAIICVPTSTSISPRAEPREQRRRPRRACRIVSRSSRATRAAGTRGAHLLLDPLGAEAGLLEVRRGALRAGRRHASPSSCSSGSGRARRPRARVDRQRDAAVRALDRAAALPAEDRRREAAAVQQHEHLLAARRAAPRIASAQRAGSGRRPGPRVGVLVAHVDDASRRASGRSSTRRSSVTSS